MIAASSIRVCIVSQAIDGPHALTPTALAAGCVARLLADTGAEVTVLLANSPPDDLPLTAWLPRFDALNIRLESLCLPDLYPNQAALSVFEELRWRDFDRIIFLDRGALGYWTIRAQRQGIAFADTEMTLLVADPSELGWCEKWTDPPHPRYLMLLEMERFLLSEVARILTISQGLADYVRSQAPGASPVVLPAALPRSVIEMIGGALGSRARSADKPDAAATPCASSAALLGVIDEASGVRAIADNLPRFWHACEPAITELIAIGATGPLATGEDGYLLLALALQNWPGAVEFVPSATLEELACAVAAQPLIVLATHNSGQDAVAQWIAAASGHAIADLAPPAGGLIGTPRPVESPGILRERLSEAGQRQPGAARAGAAFRASAAAAARDVTALFLQSTRRPAASPAFPASDTMPRVSVCISHFDKPDLLEHTLQSLRSQTYDNIEVVVYDDASPSASTRQYLDAIEPEFARRNWILVRGQHEVWPSRGRNAAAAHATGDYLLIMDGDNCARPQEIELMVRVMQRTGADAVSVFSRLFEGEGYPLQTAEEELRFGLLGGQPLGHGLSIGTIWNVFGDTNYMYRAEAFHAIGGFEDLPMVGCEDYQISARMVLAGYRLEMIPLGLYDYRFSPHNMARGMSNERIYYSHMRIARAMGRHFSCPRPAFELAAMNYNAHTQKEGESYWRHRGRLRIEEPLAGKPIWRQTEAAARLSHALTAYGANDAAAAAARQQLESAAERLAADDTDQVARRILQYAAMNPWPDNADTVP